MNAAGAFGGEARVAAHNQPRAREVGRGDTGHVALVEQGELQGAAVREFLDRRRSEVCLVCGRGHSRVIDVYHIIRRCRQFTHPLTRGHG